MIDSNWNVLLWYDAKLVKLAKLFLKQSAQLEGTLYFWQYISIRTRILHLHRNYFPDI